MASKPTVVYVHGNGNKKRRDVLKREWDVALFGVNMASATRMAYWADLLHPNPIDDRSSEEAELLANVSEQTLFAPRGEVPEVAGPALDASAGAVQLPIDLFRRLLYRADALAAGEEEESISPALLPLSRPLRQWIFRALLHFFWRDVGLYLADWGDRMRARLEDSLADLDGPIAVIGHSLGAMIAYDVLRQEQYGSLNVGYFITVGSPLAIREIEDVVTQPLQVPDSVGQWRNVADARDIVAADPTIVPEYEPIERCYDFMVQNNASWNHHSIGGYLASRPVRDPINQLLAGKT